ncbi:MAG: winged helix DNA-binding domain-containing protein [Actinomycetota bacterium]
MRSVIGIPGVHPSAPLSLLARVPRLMQGMYEGALEGRVALRLPAMRRQPHVMHGETAHLAYHACRPAVSKRTAQSRRNVADPALQRIRSEVLKAAREPRTAEQLRGTVPGAPERFVPLLTQMTNEGLLLRMRAGSVIENSFRYVATRGWLGHAMPPAEQSDALTWLAGEYMTTFGPASIADFAWWAGVEQEMAQAALEPHDLTEMGEGLKMWRRDARAFELARPVSGRVNLLPALDPYTMGYTGESRLRFADARVLPAMFDANDNSANVVLIEGAVSGLWDLNEAKSPQKPASFEMRIALFDDPGPKAWAAIQSEAQLLAGFLDAKDFRIQRAKARLPQRKPASR